MSGAATLRGGASTGGGEARRNAEMKNTALSPKPRRSSRRNITRNIHSVTAGTFQTMKKNPTNSMVLVGGVESFRRCSGFM